MFKYNSKHIKIVEVGPRDGLQNESKILELDDKFEYLRLLSQTGLKTIEATSFVRGDKIPQMADAKKLYRKINSELNESGVAFPCLVPNLRGYKDALAVGVKEISLFTATSDAFTQKNINCSVDESFKRISDVSRQAKKDGLLIRGYISTSFGCPYAGDIGLGKLEEVIGKFLDLGAYEVSIGDTIGIAHPKQVYSYLNSLKKSFDFSKLALHFHDTRGLALTNVLTSLECDINTFDSSSGGLGGCPYAKGATGNVATEELVYLLEKLGLETGIDLHELSKATSFIMNNIGRASSAKFIENE